MKVTKRWSNFLSISLQAYDMVEVNNTYYFCVPYFLSDADVAKNFENGEYTEKYTIEDLREKRCAHRNLNLMWEAVSKWRSSCECGGDATSGTHSRWCPKYEG